MGEPIEQLYFNWLCAKVLDPVMSNYMDLMDLLYRTEFVWLLVGDANRADDGCELRLDFLRETGVEPEPEWFEEAPSILEVLIAFANRAYFQTDIPLDEWFWRFIANLGLEDYRHLSDSDIPVVEEILNTFVWRTYDRKGNGGLFPMRRPAHDQREVEIWYQFSEYLEEQGLLS